MITGLVSVREGRRVQALTWVVREFDQAWEFGEPSIEKYWTKARANGLEDLSILVDLVKRDMSCRSAKGQRPVVAEYLERFPELRGDDDRVLSLIYEEFCLREESGEGPDADNFCERYDSWREPLASQLRYHRLLSQVISNNDTEAEFRFPRPGEFFEEFQLESLLGQGGAGKVFLARDRSLAGRRVALKVSPDTGREPAILGRLDHDHIVPVHCVVFQTETNLRGLCMPYRPGLPLDQVIRQLNPMTAHRRASVLRDVVINSAVADPEDSNQNRPGWQGFPSEGTYADAVAWLVAILAKALSYAHSQGILHRDVKPANVLLTLRDGPQLLDFNLAHDPNTPDQAETALRGGTLPYMAPEQLEAFIDPAKWDSVGPSADLYSLGLLMHELLTGEAPGISDPTLSLPRAIRSLLDHRATFPVSPTRTLNPNVPYSLAAITAKCLAPALADRYPDASALADDLERFLHRRPLKYAHNPSYKERAVNWSQRNRRGIVAVTAVCLILSAVFSRSIFRTLVPVERRESFLTAVRDVDSSRFREALPSLEALVDEAPNSPLPRFYLGVALLVRGDGDGASSQFASLLKEPTGESTLLAWGKTHPQVAEHCESLGLAILARKQYDLAGHAFRLARELDPSLTTARGGAAKVHLFYREYAKACELLTGLINEAETRASKDDQNQVVDWYIQRASALQLLGEEKLLRDPRGFAEARSRFLAALSDLDRVGNTLNALDTERVFQAKVVRTEILIALGSLDRSEGHKKDSHQRFEVAREIIDKELDPTGPEQRQECLRLSQKLHLAVNRLQAMDGLKSPDIYRPRSPLRGN